MLNIQLPTKGVERFLRKKTVNEMLLSEILKNVHEHLVLQKSISNMLHAIAKKPEVKKDCSWKQVINWKP